MLSATVLLDHQELVGRQPREIRRLRKLVLELAPGKLQNIAVEHEHDSSCCKKERWPVTLRTILAALKIKALYVTLGAGAEGEQTL
jgi:hypothetical protein